MTPADALMRLLEGNQRFVSGVRSVSSLASPMHRSVLAERGQNPFAMILCCSDSRSPAEHVFDAGLGELFVTRVAGNVVDVNVVGSLEYAASALGTPLCVVLGHTQCGAVNACIDSIQLPDFSTTENIESLLKKIEPAAKVALRNKDHSVDTSTAAIKANISNSVDALLSASETLREKVDAGALMVVGCLYDLKSGVVSIVDERYGSVGSASYGFEQPAGDAALGRLEL